jgi:nucleoside-diphosphate-sugar epimerase
MPLIGHGFLARHLEPFVARHPRALLIAAGVADSSCHDPRQWARERRMLETSLEQCRQMGWKAIYWSSLGHGIDDRAALVNEATVPAPMTPYGRHKIAMERLIDNSGVPYLILRVSNLVGDGQNPRQLVPALAAQIVDGIVHVSRGARRDLLHVRDAVALSDRLIDACTTRPIVNLASGFSIPIEQIVDHLCFRLRHDVRRIYDSAHQGYEVSVAELSSIVGGLDEFGFDPTYYQRVIDQHY